MGLDELLTRLGDEIEDPAEESFLLFSQTIPSSDLGFIDPKATTLDLFVAGKDLTIRQSPTLLSSNRSGGTTGAVLWKISPLFAEWIASSENCIFGHGVLSSDSTTLELGCGISGVVALSLAPRINTFIATDQGYVLKTLRQNLEDNAAPIRSGKLNSQTKAHGKTTGPVKIAGSIEALELDWESSNLALLPGLLGGSNILDAVISCDCIYNDAMIRSFVQTCAEICRLREYGDDIIPTICVVAQQLRSHSVFEAWLEAFHALFRVWRVPDDLLTTDLQNHSGFVVHIGVLRNIKV